MKRLILSVAAVSLVGVAAAQQQQKEYSARLIDEILKSENRKS